MSLRSASCLAYEVIKLAYKEMSQTYVFKQFGEFHFIRIDTCVPFYNAFSLSFKKSAAQNENYTQTVLGLIHVAISLEFSFMDLFILMEFLLPVSVTSSMHRLDFMVNVCLSVMSDVLPVCGKC